MSDFSDLNLVQPILRGLTDEGYTTPTPIQERAIPPIIEGRDLLGIAQTGTGKTAAFSLPVLNHLAKKSGKSHRSQPRALILAPTRELAGQISESLKTYGQYLHLRTAVVFGGTSIRKQIQTLNRGVHILVATPGRLLDLMKRGHVKLDRVELFVIDEMDCMLDMGFIHDVRKIAEALPYERQTIMFSATMPQAVKKLAKGLLNSPVQVEVAPASTIAAKVDQRMYFLAKDKKRLLLSQLLKDEDIKRVLIFTRTKRGADQLVKYLRQTDVTSDAIHGDKTQKAREKALKGFRSGKIRALVATDVAARGIDIDDVTHVINFDLPNQPENYVHRIGRTARAGANGVALSFCEPEERAYLRDIEKMIRQSVAVDEDHPYHMEKIIDMPVPGRKKSRKNRKRRARRSPPKSSQVQSGRKKRSNASRGSAKLQTNKAA